MKGKNKLLGKNNHLLNAYKTSPNKEFRQCITNMQDEIREKKASYTVKEVMTKAHKKIESMAKDKMLVEDDPSDEDPDHVLALKAEME